MNVNEANWDSQMYFSDWDDCLWICIGLCVKMFIDVSIIFTGFVCHQETIDSQEIKKHKNKL